MRRRYLLLALAVIMSVSLGARAGWAQAQCIQEGHGGPKDWCITLDGCGWSFCTQIHCSDPAPGYVCVPQSILECNFWGCLFASSCTTCM